MNRSTLLLCGIFLLCMLSCQNEDSVPAGSAVKINMTLDDYLDMTYVQSSRIWKGDEKVLVIDPTDDSVSDTAVPITSGFVSSLFIYNLPLEHQTHTLVGIYPANAPVSVGPEYLRFTIPQEQNGKMLDLQAGKTVYIRNSHSGSQLPLKPLYKVLNVYVDRSNHTISQVKVIGKKGELISGDVMLDVDTWVSVPRSASVTVTLNRPLDCSASRQSVAVMVADTDCEGYIAEITTVEGETFQTENVTEGFLPAEDYTYETGISQALFGSLSAVEAKSLPDAGVKYIEVTMNTFWRGYTESECYTRARSTKKIIEDTPGLEVWSVHLPFSGSLDISVLDEKKRADNVAEMAKMIRLAGEFRPKKLVLHPSSEPISETDRSRRLDNAKASIAELLPVVKEIGAELCIENLPRTCLGRSSGDMMYLIRDFPEVMVCFDSNHLLMEDHDTFFRNVGDRITTLHVSDYDRVDERHWLPGLGVIDWQSFYTNLLHYGYEGVFMTEVKSGTAADVVNACKNVIYQTNN